MIDWTPRRARVNDGAGLLARHWKKTVSEAKGGTVQQRTMSAQAVRNRVSSIAEQAGVDPGYPERSSSDVLDRRSHHQS